MSDAEIFAHIAGSGDALHAERLLAHVDGCPPCRMRAFLALRRRADAERGTGVREAGLTPSSATALLQRGSVVGEYRVLELLGVGSASAVYAAEDPRGRRVALKIFSLRASRPGEEEALILEHLRGSPGIPLLLGRGVTPRGSYLALELVPGVTLAAWMRRSRPALSRALQILTELARRLHALHQHDVVHGDLKPENVLLCSSGEPYLVDFGMSRRCSAPLGAESALRGTLAYLAPEALAGGRSSTRADQYSFCVMAHESLLGFRPHSSQLGAASWRWHFGTRRRLLEVLRRGLTSNPACRYPTMGDLADQLEGLGCVF